MAQKLTEQEIIRRGKLEKLVEHNVDPFGEKFERTDNSESIKAKAGDIAKEALEEMNIHVKTAGRIMFIRNMGKASFISIQDQQGKIQVFLGKDVVGEETYEIFKLADLGDIVGVEGKIMRTKNR